MDIDRKTELELMRELGEQREARHIAEFNLHKYREAFAWLEEQDWFKKHRHKLKAWLKETDK